MAENVYNVCQLGQQAGTFAAPDAAVDGAILYGLTEPLSAELDRASAYPAEDYGYNFDAYPGRGSHGVRGATLSLASEARFGDLQEILEMHYAGGITPTGAGPYVWGYVFETGAPSILPATVRYGSETTQDQWYVSGVLVDELTLGFDDLDAPGLHPWTVDASCLGIDRVVDDLTAALSAPAVAALESMQGHRSIISFGSTSTAFASLTELSASLVSFQIKTMRHLVLRPYGASSGDTATGYGFSAKSEGEVTFKVKIGSSSKSTLHDAWNSAGAALGEIRARVAIDGNGNNAATLDFRTGLTAVPVGERDGERVYECTGKLVRDATLDGGAKWTVTNDVATLASAA